MTQLPTKELKARRNHLCDWCLSNISPGEIYNKTPIADDGVIFNFKSHLSCTKLYEKLEMWKLGDGDGIDLNTFQEQVYNEHKRIFSTDNRHVNFEDILNQVKTHYDII